MIVNCGLTPSELGTTDPSATCTPFTPCSAVRVDHALAGAGMGPRGSKRMKGHQPQVAAPRVRRRHALGQRQVHLARAGRLEELLQALQSRPKAGKIGVVQVVADDRRLPHGERTLPRESR